MKTLFSFLLVLFMQNLVAEEVPQGFVLQPLEPTGGAILRPKDWFYSEGHRQSVYDWTLTRENTAGNTPYVTGVRIQAFVGVRQGTGKTAEQFIHDFFDSRARNVHVLRLTEAADQGLFTRICLETEEGPYHILYSLFWGSKGMDVAVVSIAGTTKELWSTYAATFDRMSAFELIDMRRFNK